MKNNTVIMTHWSAHAGKSIEDVPRSYLEWLYEQDWFEERDPDLYIEIEDVLENTY